MYGLQQATCMHAWQVHSAMLITVLLPGQANALLCREDNLEGRRAQLWVAA